MRENYDNNVRRSEMKEGTNVFRVLVKTLLGAGIITELALAGLATLGWALCEPGTLRSASMSSENASTRDSISGNIC